MEQRLGEKIAALFLRQEDIQDGARKQTPAKAAPTEQPAAADACSEALVIGYLMTFALSKHGLKAKDLQSQSTTAKVYISSIISRSDIVDDKDDTTAANDTTN